MLSTNTEFFLRVNEATEIFLRVGLTQGNSSIWQRLASSPAAEPHFLGDGLILKTA